MKKRDVFLLAALAVLVFLLPYGVSACIESPSVWITFTGSGGRTYYGTLLSERASIEDGNYSAWDGDAATAYDGSERAVWEAFVGYEDADGFYFLQDWEDCTESNRLIWGFFPPSPFKVLLYFPDSGEFLASPIYERYAYDSHYTVDIAAHDADGLIARRDYAAYTGEILNLFARIAVTVLAKLGIALLFGYREKRQLCFLAVVNAQTQAVLNIALNAAHFLSGPPMLMDCLIWFQPIVLVTEAVVYAAALHRFSIAPQKRIKAVLYAFYANAISFLLIQRIVYWGGMC